MRELLKMLSRPKTVGIMLLLEKEGELNATQTWQSIGHRTTASDLLTKLHALGFLEREVLQEKKRRVMWRLTKKGQKWCEVLHTVENWDRAAQRKKAGSR